eukprot:6652561-Pyramimonas_sp.AAC.1
MFSVLFRSHPDEFREMMGLGSMQEFWGGASRGDPRMKHHPVWLVPNYSRWCIPLRIHGDGAEMQNNDSLMT